MHHSLASLSVFLLLALPATGASRIVPLAGHTEGAMGTSWRTDLLLSNAVNQSQIIDLTFHTPMLPPLTRSIVIAPGDTVVIEDVVSPAAYAQPEQSWVGQLVIDSPHGLHASAHTWTTSTDRDGTYGGLIESYDPLILPQHGTLTGLQTAERFRSNVAFANGSSAANTIDFTVRDETGTIVRTARIDLAAHQSRQISLAHDLALGHGVYSVEWSSTRAAILIGSVIDNRSGDPSNVPSIANAHAQLCFPIVGRTEGDAGTYWSTSLAITNESASHNAVAILFHGIGEVDATKTVVVPPHGTLLLGDLMESLGLASGTGFLHITGDAPLVAAARIFNTELDGATYGSLLLPQESMAESDDVRVRGVRRTSAFRANVVLTNRTNEPTAGWLRFFDRRGDLVEKHWFVMKAHDTEQIALRGSIAEVEAGEVEVQTADDVKLLVLVSNVDNLSGDTVMREPEQEIERQLVP